MLDKGTYFSGQEMDEKVVYFTRRHALAMLSWISVISVLVIFLLVSPIIFGDFFINFLLAKANFPYTIIGVSSYILFIMALSVTAWINYYLDVTFITSRHLVNIRQVGLFNREVAEQPLVRVQDVSSKMQGFLPTLFRYGTVFVETAGDTPNFQMPNMPRPHKIANTIMKLHEAATKNIRAEEGVGQEEGEEDEEKILARVFSSKISKTKEPVIVEKPKKAEIPAIDKSPKPLNSKIEKEKIPPEEAKIQTIESKTNESLIELATIEKNPQKTSITEGELKEGEEIKL